MSMLQVHVRRFIVLLGYIESTYSIARSVKRFSIKINSLNFNFTRTPKENILESLYGFNAK